MEDRALVHQKKDLGRKAAEYVIRKMPTEFGWDASKSGDRKLLTFFMKISLKI